MENRTGTLVRLSFKRGLETHEIYEVYRAGNDWAGVVLRL
jgi:hypothetical protein